MYVEYLLTDELKWSDVERFAPLLVAERKEKVARLRFEQDRLLSLVAGLMIRRAVIREGIPYQSASFCHNEHEKPFLSDRNDLFFSVSHSRAAVAIGVDVREIGVDIEKKRSDHIETIASRFFHPDEVRFVMETGDREEAFGRIWTAKEAYLKCLGCGISVDLKGFNMLSKDLSERTRTFDLGTYLLSVFGDSLLNGKPVEVRQIRFNDLIDFEDDAAI